MSWTNQGRSGGRLVRLGYRLSDGTGELPEEGGSGTEEAGSEASLSVLPLLGRELSCFFSWTVDYRAWTI